MKLPVLAVVLALGLGVAPAAASPIRDNGAHHSIYRRCATEDGPGPCTWYAHHQGNHRGHPFRLYADGHTCYIRRHHPCR